MDMAASRIENARSAGKSPMNSDADHPDNQAGVARHEVGGDGLAAPPRRGEAVGRGQAAQEDHAHGHSGYHGPGQE